VFAQFGKIAPAIVCRSERVSPCPFAQPGASTSPSAARRRSRCTSNVSAAMALEGLHHITAITGDAARNVDFCARTTGLRLMRKTVNVDQPAAYHLYFGDEQGRARAVPRGRDGGGRAADPDHRSSG
jgi:Glyoxalase/Bleomycin resistance protein/Dioxygenase superfamily